MDLATTNHMNSAAFVATFGGVFEHSSWVAERAYAASPFASVDALHQAMAAAVANATRDEQLMLLRAHPDLAGEEARAGRMTNASVAEQAYAALDRLTSGEASRIADLNAAYRARYGFPFIVAVRNHTKESILREFERRLESDGESELAANLEQIATITRLRLAKLFQQEEQRSQPCGVTTMKAHNRSRSTA